MTTTVFIRNEGPQAISVSVIDATGAQGPDSIVEPQGVHTQYVHAHQSLKIDEVPTGVPSEG